MAPQPIILKKQTLALRISTGSYTLQTIIPQKQSTDTFSLKKFQLSKLSEEEANMLEIELTIGGFAL